MSAQAELLKRLDLIQATLVLAFAPQLSAARSELREDDISAAILDLAEDWIASTELQQQVSDRTGMAMRSVRDRLPELVGMRVLAARGSERRMEYRSTGLL
jgi:hypothetical protein